MNEIAIDSVMIAMHYHPISEVYLEMLTMSITIYSTLLYISVYPILLYHIMSITISESMNLILNCNLITITSTS
jgi:hypothetical protein